MARMRVALSFAVIGLCLVLGLWILGIVGASEALDGAARILALVAVGAGGAFALFTILGDRRPPSGDAPDSAANGPKF
jgi:threonine/homoserine efflux transporter RhtA